MQTIDQHASVPCSSGSKGRTVRVANVGWSCDLAECGCRPTGGNGRDAVRNTAPTTSPIVAAATGMPLVASQKGPTLAGLPGARSTSISRTFFFFFVFWLGVFCFLFLFGWSFWRPRVYVDPMTLATLATELGRKPAPPSTYSRLGCRFILRFTK